MKPRLIDTHAHLTMKDYDRDRAEVIQRALDEGVAYIVNIGFDLESSRAAVDLAERHDCCYAAVGVHPHHADRLDELALRELESLGHQSKVVAIGETGLDFHRNLSPQADQERAFREQSALAGRLGLPLVVHDRDAHQQTMDILRETGVTKAVLHCFAGDAAMAREAVRRGHLISVGGPVTYKNPRNLPEVLMAVSVEGLMLETDCPYLPPEPHRGKRNQPSSLPAIARKVAEILSPLTFDDVCRATTKNAELLFGIGKPDPATVAYAIRDSLYINLTNRCTNACVFCIRQKTDFIKGHNLRLDREPEFSEAVEALGDPTKYREVVFCGYGEPLLRLDLVKQLARWLKERRTRVRLNTNGQGNLINGRNVVPELAGLIDEVSVSLNAPDQATYDRICPSRFGERTFGEVKAFAALCREAGITTSVTVLDMPGVDLEACRALARELSVGIRIRHYDVVG